MIRYTISKDQSTRIRPWRVHMLDIDAGTITLIAMRQTWATCCSWLQRRIAVAEQPEQVQHALGCMCGINDAGQRFTDPICRRQ